MTLPKPKAVIFDWDNTLVDTWPVIHEAMVATFTAMGHIPWTLDETKAKVKKSMRDAFPALFGEDWEKAGELYQTHYREHSLGQLMPLPRAEDVLKKVKALGLCTVVVSNKKGPVLRREVEHMGWNGYFNAVIGANDAARDKPHPDPVFLAFSKHVITPGPHVWFVGDSDVDLDCALQCGCTGILYGASAKDHLEYTTTHFQGFPYHAHAHDHGQILVLLELT